MTPAEAAILQTFPLEYRFCGSQSRVYTQIGNAVPCNLGKAVSNMVIDILVGKTSVKYNESEPQLFNSI